MDSEDNSLTVLDCTLRDGGYYNEWNFEEGLVAKYLKALSAARVDVIEIGFRFLSNDQFLGPYAFSTDEFLETLPFLGDCRISVMINAGELLKWGGGIANAVDCLFRPAEESCVDLVRVAAHLSELEGCRTIIDCIQNKGYSVGLNLMQAGRLSNNGEEAFDVLSGMKGLEVVYLADSLGNMKPVQIVDLVEKIRSKLDCPIGMHAHNNMGCAVSNTLVAVDSGASWVDGTVLGMGRGAGNVCLEQLLLELIERTNCRYLPEAIFPLVMREFGDLQKEYKWGPSLPYYLSALYGVHPTYMQEMLSNPESKPESILKALEHLRVSTSYTFSEDLFNEALNGGRIDFDGAWNATGWCEGKDVLIIGSGSSFFQHKLGLQQFISRSGVKVLSVNYHKVVSPEIVDFYVACSRTHLVQGVEQLSSLNKPLIIPLKSVPSEFSDILLENDILDYGVTVKEGCFDIESTKCTLPQMWSSAYALAVACVGGADRIFLCGFDGYSPGDPLQEGMLKTFESYGRFPLKRPLISITPTSYPVCERSLYSLNL